jgi:hypothetical protein
MDSAELTKSDGSLAAIVCSAAAACAGFHPVAAASDAAMRQDIVCTESEGS